MVMKNVATSTVGTAAYNSRSRINDEMQNHIYDYTKKHDHIFHNIVLPNGAPESWNDKSILWNANERFETAAGTKRHGKNFIIAIPQELSHNDAEECVRGFQMFLASLGYASQADIHEPDSRRSADLIEKNRHVHILSTARQIKDGDFVKAKEKKVFANDFKIDDTGKIIPLYDPEKPDAKTAKELRVPTLDPAKKAAYEESHPETDWNGLIRELMSSIAAGERPDASDNDKAAAKDATDILHSVQKGKVRKGKGCEWIWDHVRTEDNPLDCREAVEACRKKWAELCNSFLEKEAQIDHRSYERQGIDRIPEIHEGPGAHKGKSFRAEYNIEIRKINSSLAEGYRNALQAVLASKGISDGYRTIKGYHGAYRGSDGRIESEDVRSPGSYEHSEISGTGNIPSEKRDGTPEITDQHIRRRTGCIRQRRRGIRERVGRRLGELVEELKGFVKELVKEARTEFISKKKEVTKPAGHDAHTHIKPGKYLIAEYGRDHIMAEVRPSKEVPGKMIISFYSSDELLCRKRIPDTMSIQEAVSATPKVRDTINTLKEQANRPSILEKLHNSQKEAERRNRQRERENPSIGKKYNGPKL